MPIAFDAAPAVRLHSITAGAGPVVACLHSSGGSSAQWRRLIEELQASHRLVAFDFHGHGRSPGFPGDAYHLSIESEAVLQGLPPSREPIHLVGHSYGGAVALDLAIRHPGRFASVTVFEPVLFALLDPGSAEFRAIASVGRSIARAARAGELRAAAAAFIDYWNGLGSWRGLAAEHQDRVCARIGAVARHFEALFANPLPFDRLRALQVPTLVLVGDQSPAPARAVSQRLGALPRVSVETLAGVAHMGPLTHPERVNPRIASHLRSAAALPIAA